MPRIGTGIVVVEGDDDMKHAIKRSEVTNPGEQEEGAKNALKTDGSVNLGYYASSS